MSSLRFIYRNEVWNQEDTLTQQGFLGFWRGYFVSLSCSLPSCAIYYSVFETLRKSLYRESEKHPGYVLPFLLTQSLLPFIPALASSIGQTVTCLTTSPIDRFRTQFWADRHQKVSHLLKLTINQAKSEGLPSLYHGLKPLLVRDILFSSIYWTSYERLRSSTHSLGAPPIFQNFIAGSVGGMLTSAAITPIDLVKTRQQVLNTKESIWQTLRFIQRTEGVRGLFRGLTPRVIQTMPVMSIMMIIYDGLNRFILSLENDDSSESSVCLKTEERRGRTILRISPHLGHLQVVDCA